MATARKHHLAAPRCLNCERSWMPQRYVSAKRSYCPECRSDLEQMLPWGSDVRLITGRDGSRVIVPAGRGYGLRDSKKR